MLLGPSAATPTDRRGLVARVFGGGLFAPRRPRARSTAVARAMAADARMPMPAVPTPRFGGIDAFGSVLFSDALVPFELSSALLMVAVVGAIAVARGRQGVHSLVEERARGRRASTAAAGSRPRRAATRASSATRSTCGRRRGGAAAKERTP